MVTRKIEDEPILIECCKRLFEFANEMGLKGCKVKNLDFINSEKIEPMNIYKYWICEQEIKKETNETKKIHKTKRHRKR
jgi:hypothetical protein